MKKLIIGVLAILLVLALPTSVFSQELKAREAFQALYSDWEMNGYPDNIGYVAYDNDRDKYIIGIVDTDQAAEDEIRAKLSNMDNIVFENARYSYNDLLEIQNEIASDTQDDGVYSMGIGWATINGQIRGFGETGHEFRVVVSLDEAIYDEYTARYQSQYGDMVYTELGTGPAVLDDLIVAENKGGNTNMSFNVTLLAVLTLIILAGIAINRYRYTLVKESANGHDITESRPLGRNELISAVKDSGIKPSDDLYNKIKKKINKS